MLRFRKFFVGATQVYSELATTIASHRPSESMIQAAFVVANRALCREHYRLTCRVPEFRPAEPGQYVHLSPEVVPPMVDRPDSRPHDGPGDAWVAMRDAPMLRRAFSIAGLETRPDGAHIDVIYRVVGKSTEWMESLRVDDRLSVLGPLGNRFPICRTKRLAWLVAGGVGLPPMLWLAEALRDAGRETVALCGARSADLLALTIDPHQPPAVDAARATMTCAEFSRHGVPVVIGTDDGSLGYHGHVGAALAAYAQANPVAADDVVVYTCGPEPMMRGVADYCSTRGIECHVCMERSMACGTGLCQSCVVRVSDPSDHEGWRYELCCSAGPVFDAVRIIWD